MTELTLHKSGLLYRPGTMDEDAIKDCREYLGLDPQPTDILLDVGAHIGATSATFLSVPIWYSVAVEPAPENAALLRKNLEQFGERAIIIEAACRQDPLATSRLYLNAGADLSSHRVVETRGRDSIEVATVGLEALLTAYSPTLLKVDVEGGEYELLPTISALPACVRGLAMELHVHLRDWRSRAPDVISAVEAQGFKAVRVPKVTAGNWDTVGVWLRDA